MLRPHLRSATEFRLFARLRSAQALEIDDQLAAAHVSLGYISYTYDWDWPTAGTHFDQALALNPTYTRAHLFYPLYLSSRGRSQEALAVAKSALDLDPPLPEPKPIGAVLLCKAIRPSY